MLPRKADIGCRSFVRNSAYDAYSRVSDYGVICTHYGRVSNCLDTIGMPNASDRLNQVAVESLPSTHETYTEIIAMTQYAETRAILHDVRGEWEQSAACYKLQLTALDSVADGAAPVPWLNRLVESLVRQLYGDISVLNSYIDKVYSDMYAGKDDTFDTAMIKVLLAGIRAMVGDLDGANQMYGESVKGVKKFEGHPEENGWMSLFASLHLLRYEMVKYRYSESESPVKAGQ
ncbi:hypothetical protein BC829DRAFT_44840 [Chytridium lagenaria]|nr:hypothetical protein BC829DRAFT_44840 [Chytridium lagenaria]